MRRLYPLRWKIGFAPDCGLSSRRLEAAANVRFGQKQTLAAVQAVSAKPIPDSCVAPNLSNFATSLPRLSIGCAITGLIATAVSNHAGRPADVVRTPIPGW